MSIQSKEEILHRYYKKSRHRGRGRAAVFIDKASIYAITFAAIWLAVRSRTPNRAVSIILTVCVMICILLISRIVSEILLNKHIKKMRAQARKELLRIKAAIGSRELCKSIKDKSVYVHSGIEELTADEVISSYVQGCKFIVTLAQPTAKASNLIKYLGIKIKTPYEYLCKSESELYSISEDEIDQMLIMRAEERSDVKRRSALKIIGILSKERAPKYFCCGLLLMLMSLITRSTLYYRLLASLSLLMGTTVYWSESIRSRNKEAAESGGSVQSL